MKRSNAIITAFIGTVLLAGVLWAVQAHLSSNWVGHRGFHPGASMMGFGGMGIMMLLFWGVILILIVAAISRFFQIDVQKDRKPVASLDPLEILKQRYARGEIDSTEFQTKMSDLSKP